MQSSYGKSIDYIAESPLLRSKLNQIAKYNKQTKKKIFHRRFKQAANSLKEKANDQELFSAGDEPISSVQVGNGYGASTIDLLVFFEIFTRIQKTKWNVNQFLLKLNINVL